MLNRVRLAALLLGLLFQGTLAAAEEATTGPWSGSLRSLNLVGEQAAADLAPGYRLTSTSFRLEGTRGFQPDWQLEAALDYQLFGSNQAELTTLSDDAVNRRFDLDKRWQYAAHWSGRVQVDRLSLGWSAGRLDLNVGRQAIGFGRIALVSPLDVIAPFPADVIDSAVRPGVDALRLVGHYGLDGQLGAVAVFGDHSRHDSYLLTWADNHDGIDLLAIIGRLRSRPMLGLGLAGDVGSLGLKAEATAYRGARPEQPGGDLHRHFSIAAIEAWYRFGNGLTLVSEYLYSGAGATDPVDYPRIADSAAFREGLISLRGRHYLLASPSFELHPLVTLGALLIWNLGDDSALCRPTLTVNLADNLTLELFWGHGVGKRPIQRNWQPPVMRSEFGAQGASGGLLLSCYF